QDNTNLVIKVYDYGRNVKFTQTSGTVTGTNYYDINLSTSSLTEGAFYTVELSTVKGELLKLRIKYTGIPK
ncbi:MAG TPA: hypothetical protein VL947_04660, partial [Cytophagales bacterium]|nr:hypothetical protein [Cytophagales bacterium]